MRFLPHLDDSAGQPPPDQTRGSESRGEPNEFSDCPANLEAGKANLAVRLGRERASLLYGLTSLGSWVAMLLSVAWGVPARALWFYLPVLAVSLILVVLVMRGRWRDRATLEKLCGASLVVNLGTTAAYILAFLVG